MNFNEISSTYSIEKKDQDGVTYDIRILLRNGKLSLENIGIKEKRKRNFTYLKNGITDEYPYRQLGMKEREEYMLDALLSKCPVRLVNEALEEAWLSIEPKWYNSK